MSTQEDKSIINAIQYANEYLGVTLFKNNSLFKNNDL